MQYILVAIDGFGLAYQVVQHGRVVRYVDLDGVLLFDIVPVGHSSSVVDANPPTPVWHVEPVVEPEPVPTPVVRRLSKLGYMNRFTDAELEAIYTAAKSVVSVEVWLAKFNATSVEADGTSIDLDDPRTVGGLQAMEAAGLIGEGRAAEILGA